MVVDYLFRLVHAAVADLDVVSVKDFSELVIFALPEIVDISRP